MGNCIETCIHTQQEDSKQQQMQQQEHQLEEEEEEEEDEEKETKSGIVKEGGFGKGGIRVKVVLTKEELEWLMFELKNKGNQKNLEDILEEIIGRGKKKEDEGWKPSLESIMEIPEVLEMDRS